MIFRQKRHFIVDYGRSKNHIEDTFILESQNYTFLQKDHTGKRMSRENKKHSW